MKKRIRTAAAALTLLSYILTFTAAAAGTGTYVYTNTRQLADNLQYINTVSWNADLGREESYALRLTGAGDAYPIVLGDDTIYGSLKVSQMVSYAESVGKNVLAAVNADFFSTQTGVPLGIVVEDGVYKSSPENELAVAFGADGGLFVSTAPQVTITLSNNGDGLENVNAGKTASLTHFNKYRWEAAGLYMFSSAFSTVSTRTSAPGWFVRFKILEGAPSVSGQLLLQVTEKLTSDGAVPIGDGYLLLTADDASARGDAYDSFAVGDYVTFSTVCNDPGMANARWATGGGDVLIRDGAVTDSVLWDKDLLVRSPKTAIGVTADGAIVTYVLDGRDTTLANGLTLKDFADELLRQGCVTAVNLDGGGSSAMSVRLPGSASAAVVNRPSDGSERKCSTYILFVTDRVSGGAPAHLAAVNDGTLVLPGSSFELIPTATDSGYRPAAVPRDVTAGSAGLGAAAGLTYTAGLAAGVDTVWLASPSTGASGSAEVHILREPTTVYAIGADGAALSDVTLPRGGALRLAPAATYYRKTVIAQANSFTYTVTGDVGTVTPDGVFTADGVGSTGELIISVGTRQAAIRVSVQGFEDTVGHWAREYIDELVAKRVVTGVTSTVYAPEANIKRCDFVLMLYRAAGEPEPAQLASFDDVAPDSYYARAVAWAKEEGISTGLGDGRFDPNAPLTREQAFTFVYRALKTLKIDREDGSELDLALFADAVSLADYAAVPSATLIKLGVIDGSNGALSPKGSLTRAQMAKVLCAVLRLAETPVAVG
ncbi:MAG: phosphodiester glycosidase family protein [Oscillospiraceae bacterium]|jgi:exopolysaccharide biosynthesis protein|nr:phosphodiester glycosidase family protein [Oscillospiraceae bacterium]